MKFDSMLPDGYLPLTEYKSTYEPQEVLLLANPDAIIRFLVDKTRGWGAYDGILRIIASYTYVVPETLVRYQIPDRAIHAAFCPIPDSGTRNLALPMTGAYLQYITKRVLIAHSTLGDMDVATVHLIASILGV
jgi:hypothetical protein